MSVVSGNTGEVSIADGVWSVGPGPNELAFAVKAMWGLTTVRGTFGACEGSVTVRAPAVTGALAIHAESIGTGNNRRDRHLRSPDFFDAERHPRILFNVTAVAPSDHGLSVGGELQIATTRLPLQLPLRVEQTSDGVLHVRGTTTISRTAAGVAWNALGMIRDEVTLHVRLTLVRAASSTLLP